MSFFMLLSSVVVLTNPKVQIFYCATFACSELYGPRVLSSQTSTVLFVVDISHNCRYDSVSVTKPCNTLTLVSINIVNL